MGAVLPFVAAPVGDLAAVHAAAVVAAQHWHLARPELLRMGMNGLFSAGDEVVLRVSRPTTPDAGAAIRVAERLAGCGVRVPRYAQPDVVEHDGLAVFAIRRETVVGPIDWAEVGAMVAVVHALDPASIDRGYPLPRGASFPWWQFDTMLADVGDLLDDQARAGLDATLERYRGWSQRGVPEVLCHGDVHPGNVIQTAEGAMLIDWDLLCLASPGWDHGPLMTWTERWGGEPGVYEAFAAGYGHSLSDDPSALAVAELRLVAATLMRLRAGRTDPVAMAEAQRRLRWWRGDIDAPGWQAQ